MTINETVFQQFCSTAASPVSYGVLDMCLSSIESAKGTLIALVGNEIYSEIPDIESPLDLDPTDGDCLVAYYAYRYVCTKAMYHAIPQLDLTLSPTGFGIVNSQNVAPASTERVERLRQQMLNASEDALDDLVDALRGNPKWCESPQAVFWFSTLVWRASMLKRFGVADPHRRDITMRQVAIRQAEIALRNLLGNETYDSLTSAIRCKTETAPQQMIIDRAVDYIADYSCNDVSAANFSKRNLLALLDNLIEFFPEYHKSSAYEANHFKPYENEKNDPCFFFG